MPKERILIVIKTYPVLSKKYTELVCTAGVREDGSFVRIYPSPFRFLSDESKYRKYQWIELDLAKNKKDIRPESYNPINIDEIETGKFIGTGSRGDWAERKILVLEKNKTYTNLQEIIDGAKSNQFSIVIFKPKEILDLVVKEESSSEWEMSKKDAALAAQDQGSLFDENKCNDFELVRKLPYKFSYRFVDDTGKESTLMIEDWEIGQLYWNCADKHGKETAIKKVKQKYLDAFVSKNDIHLFLGTTSRWHLTAHNPYVIVGVFYPPIVKQLSLF